MDMAEPSLYICDLGTRRFYTADPWGNRIELLAT